MRYRPRRWKISRKDGGFVYTTRNGWLEPAAWCRSYTAAIRLCRALQRRGHQPVLEKWVRLSERSPKRRHGPYRVHSYTLHPQP